MKLMLWAIVCLSVSLFLADVKMVKAQTGMKPPIAEKKPTVLTKHGQDRVDEYFWLKERESQQVVDYLKKEKKKEKVKAVFQSVEKGYLDVMKAYFTKDRKLADSVALQREKMLEETALMNAGTAELLRTMVTLTNNIARSVIDEE